MWNETKMNLTCVMRLTYVVLIAVFTVFAKNASSQVVINEFSGANYDNYQDNFGEYEDWIELYNTSPVPADISGYYLSDRINNNTKYQIPDGTTIGGNGFLVFICDSRNVVGGGWYHTNFRLTQTDLEPIVLSNASATIVDSFEPIAANQTNHSRGRATNGGANWGVFTNPTPGQSNNSNTAINEYPVRPLLSQPAGFYAGSVTVAITAPEPNTMVYYTTNGSAPTNGSILYTAPISITQTTVIRAIAISSVPNTPPGFIETNTYFINEPHTVDVISISGNQVLTLLNGDQLNPVGHFEYFGADGELKDEALGEYNKHGNDSWGYPQRGIDYITRDQFGYNHEIEHKIFNGTDRQDFQKLILKAGANDNYPFSGGAHIRDSYLHSLSQVAGMEMDERTHQSCILFANGQYWGVYDVREKVDDHDYTQYYYNQDRFNIDFLKTWGGTWAEYGTNADWIVFRDFVLGSDMTIPANYDQVDSQFETLSLIDYFILNSYAVCSDWLNWNTAWWKGNNPQGGAQKWRYILWDLDASFGHYINYTGIPDQSANANICFPEVLGNPGGQGHVPIWNKLLTNETFFAKYVNRLSDMSNTYYSCESLHQHLDSLTGIIAPEMPRQIDRWGGNMATWEANVQQIHDFIEIRCNYINNNILGCYDELDGPYLVTVKVTPAPGGKVKVNTINPQTFPFSGEYFGGINQTLKALPQPGYNFSHWSSTVPGMITNPNTEEITFLLTADVEVTAHFIPFITHSITFMVEPEGAGTITIDGATMNVFPDVKLLTAVVDLPMFATENAGYQFEKWEVSMPNQLSDGSLSIVNNLQVFFQGTVKAIFSEKLYDVSFDVEPRGFGSITLNDEVILDYPEYKVIWGDQITSLKASTTEQFYVFDGWKMNFHVPTPSLDDEEVQVEFTNNDDVVATFREIPNYELTFITVPEGKGMIRFGDKVIDQFPHKERFVGGESFMLEAIPAFKQKFTKWEFVNRPLLPGTNPIMQYTVIKDDIIVLYLDERFSDVFIPNSFTPNGDGVNEIFKVIGTEILDEEFSISIYNRWGDKVFETNDINQGWNGSMLNSGYYCPTAIYVYTLKYKNAITTQTHELNGQITLVR